MPSNFSIRISAQGILVSHVGHQPPIAEKLFINLSVPYVLPNVYWDEDIASSSVHCVVITASGYFELGKHSNGYYHQPLLQSWPDEESTSAAFSSHIDAYARAAVV